MTQEAKNNAIVLHQLGISKDCVKRAEEIYLTSKELQQVLMNPVLSLEKKQNIIEKVFQDEACPMLFIRFLKKMCEYHRINDLKDTFLAFYEYANRDERILPIKLWFTHTPEVVEYERIHVFLANKYPGWTLEIEEHLDETLLGGFIIQVNNEVFDWSFEGQLKQLEKKLTGR